MYIYRYVNDVNEDDNMNPEPQYLEYSQLMAENEQSTMEINFQHISEFDSQLADTIAINYYRCEPYQQEALCKQMQDQYPESSILNDVPRPYYVSIYNYPLVFSIRDLKTTRVGYLIAVQGTITRTTQARPEQLLANFRCLECNTKIQNIPQQFKYTQPTICPTEHCGNKTTFLVQPEESEFNDWQQVCGAIQINRCMYIYTILYCTHIRFVCKRTLAIYQLDQCHEQYQLFREMTWQNQQNQVIK